MLHVDLINRIIEAEKTARTVSETAAEKLNALEGELKLKQAEMEKTYFERAKRRIKEVEKTEKAYADETIAELEAQLERDLKNSEQAAAEKSKLWADILFNDVIEFPFRV